jgi:hypothetical protein
MTFFLVVAGLVSSGAVVAAVKARMASKGKREQVQSFRLK